MKFEEILDILKAINNVLDCEVITRSSKICIAAINVFRHIRS